MTWESRATADAPGVLVRRATANGVDLCVERCDLRALLGAAQRFVLLDLVHFVREAMELGRHLPSLAPRLLLSQPHAHAHQTTDM